MGARGITGVAWFEKHMEQVHRELEMMKKKKERDRREHRLQWRRAYYRKQRGQVAE